MFCSIFGLSPMDLILESIDPATFRGLIGILNNRFDFKYLEDIRSELFYFYNSLKDGVNLDYQDPEARRIAKRKNAGLMTAFGEAEERLLGSADKVFDGNFKSLATGNKIKISSEKTKKILERLYNSREKLHDFAGMVEVGNYQDEKFFGMPIGLISFSSSKTRILKQAVARLSAGDDVKKLLSDSVNLLQYLETGEESTSFDAQIKSYDDLISLYTSFSGEKPSDRARNVIQKFVSMMSSVDLTTVRSSHLAGLENALFYCLESEKRFDAEVCLELEECGLFGMSNTKADFFLDMVGNVTFISEGKSILKDVEDQDTYQFILQAVARAAENYLTPVGPLERSCLHGIENI